MYIGLDGIYRLWVIVGSGSELVLYGSSYWTVHAPSDHRFSGVSPGRESYARRWRITWWMSHRVRACSGTWSSFIMPQDEEYVRPK